MFVVATYLAAERFKIWTKQRLQDILCVEIVSLGTVIIK